MNWHEWSEEQNKLWDEVVKADKEAKAKGTLIGRYISEGIADGTAIYQVVSVTKTKAKIKHIHLWDGYRITFIEQTDCKILLKYIRARIDIRDSLEEAFTQ